MVEVTGSMDTVENRKVKELRDFAVELALANRHSEASTVFAKAMYARSAITLVW